jgi:hypothetical protein
MYRDLLAQAKNLATADVRKPKQANLRRAISAAYYGLFHFLVDQSCRTVMGTQQSQVAFRHVLARAFVHSDMRSACESFSGGTLKQNVRKGLPGSFAIPKEIKHIASTFVALQSKRHLSDYDLSERFSRSDVLNNVREAEIAIDQFSGLPSSDEKTFFLACLWAWKNLATR